MIASGLARPEGIARLDNGTLAVAEAGTRRLLLVDPAASLPRAFAEISAERAAALLANGTAL